MFYRHLAQIIISSLVLGGCVLYPHPDPYPADVLRPSDALLSVRTDICSHNWETLYANQSLLNLIVTVKAVKVNTASSIIDSQVVTVRRPKVPCLNGRAGSAPVSDMAVLYRNGVARTIRVPSGCELQMRLTSDNPKDNQTCGTVDYIVSAPVESKDPYQEGAMPGVDPKEP